MIASPYTVHFTAEMITTHVNTKYSLLRDTVWRTNIESMRSYLICVKEKANVPWQPLVLFWERKILSCALRFISMPELSTDVYSTRRLCRCVLYHATNHTSAFPDVTSAAALLHRPLLLLRLLLPSCLQHVPEYAQLSASLHVLRLVAVHLLPQPHLQYTIPCLPQHLPLLPPALDRARVHALQCVQSSVVSAGTPHWIV